MDAGASEAHAAQHRHVSHLIGLFPDNQITTFDTPELAAAVKRSLELRGDGGTGCGQKVSIRSEAGLIELPFKSAGSATPRRYAYGHLISDVPVSCWGCTEEDTYVRAFGSYKPELFRDVIRAALQTW